MSDYTDLIARLRNAIQGDNDSQTLFWLSADAIAALVAERDAAVADAERLRIRGAAYEEAFRIAYQATYQSHNGHWDHTMQGGVGCRECIKAREAREACDEALRVGLDRLVERAGTPTGEAHD